jgi:hypothetical protein
LFLIDMTGRRAAFAIRRPVNRQQLAAFFDWNFVPL